MVWSDNSEFVTFINRLDKVLKQAELAQNTPGKGLDVEGAMGYVADQRWRADLTDLLGKKTVNKLEEKAVEMQRKFSEAAKAAEQAQVKAVARDLPHSDVAFLQNLSDLVDMQNIPSPSETDGGDLIDRAVNQVAQWQISNKKEIEKAVQEHVWNPTDFGYTRQEINATTNRVLDSMPGLETSPIAKYRNALDMEKWLKMNIPEVENLDRLLQTSGGPVVKNVAPKVGEAAAAISPFAKAAKPVLKALGATADIGFLSELLHANSSVGYTQTNIGPVPVPQIPRSAKPVLETASRLGMLLGGGGTQGFGTAPAPVGGVPARGTGSGGRAWME